MKPFADIRRTSTSFHKMEDGAITVDWVVLTGVILALGLAATLLATASLPDLAEGISSNVANIDVNGS